MQGRARQGQTVNAREGHRIGCGLQAGPSAGSVSLAGEHGQTKLSAGQLDTNGIVTAAIDANERTQIATAHCERIHCNHFATGQCHTLTGFFHRQKALQRDKVKGVDAEITAGPSQLAQGTIAVKCDRAARSSQHLNLAQSVVNHHIGRSTNTWNAPVDLDRQIGGADVKVFHAHKANEIGCGFEGGKAAPGRFVCQAFGGQSQTKVNALQGQAQGIGGAPVQSGKRINAAAADGEQVGGDERRCLRFTFDVRIIAIVQIKNFGTLFDGKATAGLEETKHIQIEVA